MFKIKLKLNLKKNRNIIFKTLSVTLGFK